MHRYNIPDIKPTVVLLSELLSERIHNTLTLVLTVSSCSLTKISTLLASLWDEAVKQRRSDYISPSHYSTDPSY